MRLRVVASGAPLALSACSLVTSFSGLTGGGASIDAGEDAYAGAEGGAAEAGGDAGEPGDGRAPIDGPLDAPPSGCGDGGAGLLAYWPMHEGMGTTVFDCSGNGLNGTVVGPLSWSAGHAGAPSLRFDGTGYVSVPHTSGLQLTGAFSVTAWVNFAPSNDSIILAKGGAGGMRGWDLDHELDDSFGFYLSADGTNQAVAVVPPDAGLSGNWVHVAAVFEPGVRQVVYLGANQVAATVLVPSAVFDQPLDLRIGQRSDGCCTMKGRLEELRLYGRALSSAEVAALATP